VGWFRREPLHEKLAREGGLGQPAPLEPEPAHPLVGAFQAAGLTGIPRTREWDAVVVTEAPEIRGDEVDFVTLPDGSIIVEDEEGDTPLEPLADAVEERIERPYRARGVRQTGMLWAVSARRIDVAEFEGPGDVVELARSAEGTTIDVDGERSFGSVPALERLAEERYGPAFAVHAERIDGNAWEIRGVPL
jgi:hypothetical protein